MAGERLVYVKADATTEEHERVRQRGREAYRRYAEAQRELKEAMVEVDRLLGPDPRATVADQAIEQFCAQIVGRPSILAV